MDHKTAMIESGDDIMTVLDKVNALLEPLGVQVEDDGLPHDGFILLTAKETK